MVRTLRLPRRMPAVVEEFCNDLWVYSGLADRTTYSYRQILLRFDAWLTATTPNTLLTATEHDVLKWFAELAKHNQISARTQAHYLAVVRRFYRFLAESKRIVQDPTRAVEPPRYQRALPRVPTQADLSRLLSREIPNTHVGLRDKALLELLYATGLRNSELAGLLVRDLNTAARTIRVVGKGEVPRLVLYGRECAFWLNLYLSRSRPALRLNSRVDHVFLTPQGRPLQSHGVRAVVKHQTSLCLNTVYAPHAIRHAFATHMLERGAQIQIIQRLLGHASPSTTQQYTHLTTHHLRTAHVKHPRDLPSSKTKKKPPRRVA